MFLQIVYRVRGLLYFDKTLNDRTLGHYDKDNVSCVTRDLTMTESCVTRETMFTVYVSVSIDKDFRIVRP